MTLIKRLLVYFIWKTAAVQYQYSCTRCSAAVYTSHVSLSALYTRHTQ